MIKTLIILLDLRYSQYIYFENEHDHMYRLTGSIA